MAIEFGVSIGTPHHNYALILDTDPLDANWHSIDLSGTIPLGAFAVFVDGHITSISTDDSLRLADSGAPSHYHHVVTNVANKEAHMNTIVEIAPATRLLWWQVSNARVTDVQIHMYWSFR